DQPLEWSTVWGFMLAAVFFARAAFSQRRARPVPWFFVGLTFFCLLFALEEISWGQRLFGYTPPRYFLENNYQLEFNLHNVLSTSLRQQILCAILIVYGLLLPLLDRIPPTEKALGTLGITAPPLGLAPIFGALLGFLIVYPLPYSGELVEAGMAFAFLFAAITISSELADDSFETSTWPVCVGALSIVIMLGFAGAIWSRGQLAADPVVAEVAGTELRALEDDLRALIEEERDLCGRHDRVSMIARLYPSDTLKDGRFTRLTRQGLPTERAEFFLDPWSTAYWVRTSCNDERDKVFLYSFGPNRRRDSAVWELSGDDIGVIVRLPREKNAPTAMAPQPR
ncbi:MAG: hypothetical protein WBM46_13230, partial [Polyangiales bacterium]